MYGLIWYGDEGHGEHGDPGACSDGLQEHAINVVVAESWATRMRQRGHTVYLEQGNLEIGDSARSANAYGATHIISFHENAGGGDRGEIIYAWKDGSLELANAIAKGLEAAGQSFVKILKCKGNSNGTAEYFGILRISQMPGVIVECAFLDNYVDRQIIDTVLEQQAMGIAIADAICSVYGGNPVEDNSAYIWAVNELVAKGKISSPDYWINSVANNTPISGEWMSVLIQRITGKSDLQSAVASLVSAGVIGSPDYWLTNCTTGKTVNNAYVKILIPKAVSKLGL